MSVISYFFSTRTGANDKDVPLNILSKSSRLTPADIKSLERVTKLRENYIYKFVPAGRNPRIGSNDLLIDVRSKTEFYLCKLPLTNCRNVPLKNIVKKTDEFLSEVDFEKYDKLIFLCRRGNDSQRAVAAVKGTSYYY